MTPAIRDIAWEPLDFDDFHGTVAVDRLYLQEVMTQLNNTPRKEEVDELRRQLAQLQQEDHASRSTTTLDDPRNTKTRSPRKSTGGLSVGSPQIIEFPSFATATDISRTESVYLQTKFIDSVWVGHDQFDDVLKMMEVKRLIFGTT